MTLVGSINIVFGVLTALVGALLLDAETQHKHPRRPMLLSAVALALLGIISVVMGVTVVVVVQ